MIPTPHPQKLCRIRGRTILRSGMTAQVCRRRLQRIQLRRHQHAKLLLVLHTIVHHLHLILLQAPLIPTMGLLSPLSPHSHMLHFKVNQEVAILMRIQTIILSLRRLPLESIKQISVLVCTPHRLQVQGTCRLYPGHRRCSHHTIRVRNRSLTQTLIKRNLCSSIP